MYKRQIYQIAESNRIEKIDSVARIESNRNFLPELECSTQCSSCRLEAPSSGVAATAGAGLEWCQLQIAAAPDRCLRCCNCGGGRTIDGVATVSDNDQCLCLSTLQPDDRPCHASQPAAHAVSVSLSHATARRQHPAQRASCTRLMALVMFTSAATLLLRLR